jgi:NAD+ synthase
MCARPEAIVEWLRRRLLQSAAHGFVFGLSGGVDSAVVARLCQAAAPDKVLGVLLPCHGDGQDDEDARLVAAHFNIPTVRVDLAAACDVLNQDLQQALGTVPPEQRTSPAPTMGPAAGGADDRARVATENVAPRLRMTALYFLAESLNYLVAGAGNRGELAVGRFTKHGDGGVDVMPIGALFDNDVRAAARELGVPQPIIDKPRGGGAGPGQTEEAAMGFTYMQLEQYLTKGPEAVAPALAVRIERLMRASEHKRSPPSTPDS